MSAHTVNVTTQNFQDVLLQGSMSKPVLVEFYLPDHPACNELSQTLAELAQQYQGRFTLARVNCDAEQMLAAQFQIQSVPTVYLLQNGQPVDGFAGPQPKATIEALLAKYLPDPAEEALASAQQLLADGNNSEAIKVLTDALPGAKNVHPLNIALASAYLKEKRLDEAETLLATIPMAEQDSAYKSAIAELELQKDAADTPEIRALTEALAEAPDDNSLKLKLAVQLHAVGRNEEALEALLTILQQDLHFQDGEAKKTCLDILAALGQGNALAATYRRKLFTLLY
ncbi:tetratricopeptide repeat protein [Gallaecimonas sp. GXIMD1310]|uniref:tetratricopeptide repeat protein n=1 Tax=Gallaecimonas sp. GXIMD1310 TaxID=3131926 RepID=UPI00324E0C93